MKKLILLFLVFFGLLSAQDDYQDWLKKEQNTKKSYISAEKQLYEKFLKKNWENFKVFNGFIADDTPKPTTIPKVEEKKLKTPQTSIKEKKEIKVEIIDKISEVEEIIPKKIKEPKVKKIEKSKVIKDEMEITFYNQIFTFSELKLNISIPEKITKKVIAKFWSEYSNLNELNILKNEIQKIKEDYTLNDWAIYSLLFKIGEKNSSDRNGTMLFTWMMLNKFSYKSKVGFDNNKIVILLSVEEMVYNVPYLLLKDEKYFLMEPDGFEADYTSLTTYDDENPKMINNFSLKLEKLPKFTEKKDKLVKFVYENKDYEINFSYNRNIVDFLENYPKTTYSVYFNAPLFDESYLSILKQFEPILEGKDKIYALNILLRFVQTSFDYQTDEQQFGYEKCLFAEETLYYPYCDCEDRSVIFTYLVKNLLDLEVIGLDYPGHVATAVRIEGVEGDRFEINKKSYLICDPTYINANIGVSMPRFKDISPEIIDIFK